MLFCHIKAVRKISEHLSVFIRRPELMWELEPGGVLNEIIMPSRKKIRSNLDPLDYKTEVFSSVCGINLVLSSLSKVKKLI
jgi:hypothetical protein